MIENKPRNYVKKKKSLNECFEKIKKTLEDIRNDHSVTFSDEEIEKIARESTQSVEAACWSPQTHITQRQYQKFTEKKTKEVCNALRMRYTPRATGFIPHKTVDGNTFTNKDLSTTLNSPKIKRSMTPIIYPLPNLHRFRETVVQDFMSDDYQFCNDFDFGE